MPDGKPPAATVAVVEIGRATCMKCRTGSTSIPNMTEAKEFMDKHAEHGGFVLLTEVIPADQLA